VQLPSATSQIVESANFIDKEDDICYLSKPNTVGDHGFY
jgi:hypothetical protein